MSGPQNAIYHYTMLVSRHKTRYARPPVFGSTVKRYPTMAKAKSKNRKSKKSSKSRFTASTADKYELYQLSVQSPEPDVEFLARVYKKERSKPARHFREDFSGTGLLTAHWVKRGSKYTAEAFDIDPEPIEWGKTHVFAKIGKAATRAVLHQADVRAPSNVAPDVRCAQNFSYWIFKTRAEMLGYFSNARADLADNGVFVLDVHGGPESMEHMEEETKIDEGFTYVWDQDFFSPVTHEARLFIHFKFKDGTRMKRAFRYEWRLWTIPELTEILTEAGFSQVDCYWEGTDKDGESGNGVFRKTRYGENDLSWVSYLVALK